jgi:hypothetical protein
MSADFDVEQAPGPFKIIYPAINGRDARSTKHA